MNYSKLQWYRTKWRVKHQVLVLQVINVRTNELKLLTALVEQDAIKTSSWWNNLNVNRQNLVNTPGLVFTLVVVLELQCFTGRSFKSETFYFAMFNQCTTHHNITTFVCEDSHYYNLFIFILFFNSLLKNVIVVLLFFLVKYLFTLCLCIIYV